MIKIIMCGFSCRVGGIETFVLSYLKKLNLNKFQIDFIDVYNPNVEKEYYNELKKYGNIYYLSNYRKYPFKFFKEILNLQRKNNYDIFYYHMSSCVYLAPLFAAKLCRIKRIISHAHNDASDKGILKNIIHKINKKILPMISNCYFACSDNAAKWFFPRKIYKNKNYKIIDNSVNVKKFYYNEEIRKKIRDELKIKKNTIVFGNVGNFKKIKNHDFLVDIFYCIHKKNQDSILMLIGEGERKEHIQKKVKKYKLSDCVIFLGKKDNICDYLCAMDTFIFPSIHEGLGISYIEAQLSGLPCLVSSSIPKDADISTNIIRLSIQKKADIWAENALKLQKNNERKYDFTNCKYDINIGIKKFENELIEIAKIKIVHFVYGIKNGGVEKVLTSYFSNINRELFKLYIITQGESDKTNLEEFEKLDFKIYTVTKKRDSFFSNYIETMKILRKNHFDISHCHMSITNFFPILYSYLAGIKVRINHSHNAFSEKKFFEKILVKCSNLLCTHKMACSEEAAEWLFNNKNKAYILYNAIYTNNFVFDKNAREDYRKKFEILPSDFVIGMVARFEKQKNHEFILRIAEKIIKKYKNIKFVFVGIGELESEIKNKADNLSVANNFIFLSSRNDVNKLYSMFDLFVLPSLYEGLGIVLVESQISGLKCFTSNFVPKSVNFSKNVSFLPLEEDIWVSKIENIINNTREPRIDYSKEAEFYGYNISKSAKKLEDYYIQIYKRR